MAMFALASVAIGVIWYAAIRAHEQAVIEERQRELLAISELKIGYLRNWLAERRRDAKLAAMSPLIAQGLAYTARDAARPDSPAAAIVRLLEATRQAFGYEAALLVDAEGRPRLTAGPPRLDHIRTEAAAHMAARVREPFVSEFYGRPRDTHVDLDVIAPITEAVGDEHRTVGAIILHLDPEAHLYPVLRQWPSPSESAETMLVQRTDDEVIYLTPLRHGSEFGVRAPIDSPMLPAAMAARGERGIREGLDYRGRAVFAAIGPVPDTSWIVVSKVDRDEVLAPVRRRELWSGAATILLLSVMGFATWLWWRQKRADYRLAEHRSVEHSQTRFRKLIENAWDFTAIVDRGMVVRYESPSILRRLGFGAAGRTGRLSVRHVHPDDMARVQQAYAAVLARPDQPQVVEHRLQRADGAWLNLETVVTNHLDDPDIGGLVLNARDVTARAQAEQSLQDSEERFRTVFEHSPLGLVLSGRDGLLRMPNPALCRILGYTKEELSGMSFADVTYPEDVPRNRELRRQLYDGHVDSFAMEKRYVRKDGGVIWADLVAGSIRDARGAPLYAVAIVHDITERKEAEKKRLEFASQQRDALIREVHHRIKNHLQGLVGLLRQHVLDHPEARGQLEGVVAQINAISIVHGLQGREKRAEVRIASLVRDITGFLGGLATVPIETSSPSCAAACTLAEEESVPVALILNELVTNAVRHGRPNAGVPVSVRVECSEEGAAITIRNAGDCPAGLDFAFGKGLGTGLTLIRSLLPPAGAQVRIGATPEGVVEATLELGPPVLVPAPGCREVSRAQGL